MYVASVRNYSSHLNWPGWLYDVAGDYSVAFYACGCAAIIPATLMFAIPWLRPSTPVDSSPQSVRSVELDLESRPGLSQGMSHDELLHTYFGCLCARRSERADQETNYDVLLSSEGITRATISESTWTDYSIDRKEQGPVWLRKMKPTRSL